MDKISHRFGENIPGSFGGIHKISWSKKHVQVEHDANFFVVFACGCGSLLAAPTEVFRSETAVSRDNSNAFWQTSGRHTAEKHLVTLRMRQHETQRQWLSSVKFQNSSCSTTRKRMEMQVCLASQSA